MSLQPSHLPRGQPLVFGNEHFLVGVGVSLFRAGQNLEWNQSTRPEFNSM